MKTVFFRLLYGVCAILSGVVAMWFKDLTLWFSEKYPDHMVLFISVSASIGIAAIIGCAAGFQAISIAIQESKKDRRL